MEELDAADILILPSAYETFGTVALEALARERFVIASSGCGIAEWPALADGKFVVPKKNSLTRVLQDMQEMPAMDRLQKARQSWDAVRDFNTQAVHEWLGFFSRCSASCGSLRQE